MYRWQGGEGGSREIILHRCHLGLRKPLLRCSGWLPPLCANQQIASMWWFPFSLLLFSWTFKFMQLELIPPSEQQPLMHLQQEVGWYGWICLINAHRKTRMPPSNLLYLNYVEEDNISQFNHRHTQCCYWSVTEHVLLTGDVCLLMDCGPPAFLYRMLTGLDWHAQIIIFTSKETHASSWQENKKFLLGATFWSPTWLSSVQLVLQLCKALPV